MRKALAKTKKELASQFYQRLSGHAAVADHLVRLVRPQETDVGFVGLGRGRPVSTFLSSAEGGSRGSEGCGRGSSWTAGTEGRHQFDDFLGMRGPYRRSWSF